ncbi:MAG: hydrogenase HycQ [Myxococcales bacterium]
MDVALLLVPWVGAVVALLVSSDRMRPFVLVATTLGHLGLSGALLALDVPPTTGWLALDPPARLVLPLVSVVFAGASVYGVGYLRLRTRTTRVFVACLSALLGTLTLAILAQHLGIMWVAIEGSALAAAPLIYFNRSPRSIEATWKYLLVGSVGVALALLGTFFLAYAALHAGVHSSLLFDDLAAVAPQLSAPWVKAAFVLLLVGYGTKMGLAPMHAWKPDAYGEAPGLVGALFAAGVTSAAFLAVLRVFRVVSLAGQGEVASDMLVVLGLLSMGLAAAMMLGQRDIKRMLAWSSVEHMGILAVGTGVGGAARYGALLHLLTNGVTKGVVFLSAANLHRAYGSKSSDVVTGALRGVPVSGWLFLLGFFAVTGAPPFGPFLSELTIVLGALSAGHALIAALFVAAIMVVFIGMAGTVLRVSFGEGGPTQWKDTALMSSPIVGFLLLSLWLGVAIPAPVDALIQATVAWLAVP